MGIQSSEFKGRVGRVRSKAVEKGFDAYLVFSPNQAYHWAYPSTGHVTYLTNWRNEKNSILVLPIDREPVLLVTVPMVFIDDAKNRSWIKDVRPVASPGQEKGNLPYFGEEVLSVLEEADAKKGTIGTAGFANMPSSIYEGLKSSLPDSKFVEASNIILAERAVKSEGEIELLRKSAELSDIALESFVENANEAMPGYELQATMQYAVRSRGADFAVFWMASGPNENWTDCAPTFELYPHERKIQRDDQIMVGTQLILDGYWGHAIRAGTLGRPSEQQRKMFESSLEAQNKVVDGIEQGYSVGAATKAGNDIVRNAGIKIGSRIGHGLGLDYTDPPSLFESDTASFREGMVVEIHPLLNPPTGGLYAAIGDMFLVGKGRVEILTKFPRELFNIKR